MNNQIALAITLAALSASLFIYVAVRLGTRKLESAEDQRAWQAFRIWWFALAASTLIGAGGTLLAVMDVTSVFIHQGLNLLNLLAISLALWGLLYYLTYVFTGRPGLGRPIAFFYTLFFAVLLAFVVYQNPIGVELGDWRASIVYENEVAAGYTISLLLALILPPLLSSIAMFTLVFRVSDRSQKYRTAVVSLCIALWFGTTLVASFAGLNENPAWPLASRLIALAAAIFVLWAYFPPTFIRNRLMVQGI